MDKVQQGILLEDLSATKRGTQGQNDLTQASKTETLSTGSYSLEIEEGRPKNCMDSILT
ncbi:Hypothetical protein FKW44_004391 [Caligus rogercresseyi]|uniref:Uncharacterized protein n=1 Tax=Caligus rogercresseyi TaxID=217165 RepID=A0A7T8KAJ3_CALRO|nr:Hypothetical protein FKW44_004391 [Caligus rogercresseyi]